MFKTLVLILLVLAEQAFSQLPEKYSVFTGKGDPSSIADIVKALENTDAVFLGEMHDDSIGHAVQFEIFKQAVEKFSPKRKVTLSLEMFESDVQVVLNEYFKGQISENHFLLSSRPWGNYKTDYRPLVELAKEKKLDVVAANAPRRYVNMVSRGGRETLSGLSKEAKAWLPPLPYAEASEAYAKKFKALMGPSPEAQMGIDKILSSQSLWDASMAYSVAQSLTKNKGSLVVHLNGGFHTENRLGTVEHFLRYRKKAKALVVTIKYVDDFKTFDRSKYTDIGDYVILTQPKPKTTSVIKQIIDRIDKFDKSLKSMKAAVTMTQYNSQLNESDVYKGNLTYVAVGSRLKSAVRVDWSSPKNERFSMVDGKYGLYRPLLNELYYGELNAQSKEPGKLSLQRFLTMTSREFRSEFQIAYTGEETLFDKVRTWHLQFIPNNQDQFKIADVWISADGMPRQIKVTAKNNDSTTVHLSDVQTNVVIDGKVFILTLPKDVRRIAA